MAQQLVRATTGFTPDKFAKSPVDSSRFFSSKYMEQAIKRATAINKMTGQTSVSVKFSTDIGEGYLNGGNGGVVTFTNIAKVFFRSNGDPITAFPLLK